MQDLTTRTTTAMRELGVRLQLALAEHGRRLREERGAAAVEYVGIIVVAALIMAAFFSMVDPIKNAFTDSVNKIIDK